MIISRTDALKLVADHSLVTAIPALLPLVERYAQEARGLEASNCRKCDRRAKLAPLGEDVLSFLSVQPSSVIDVLRARLNDPNLYIYAPGRHDGVLMELGRN